MLRFEDPLDDNVTPIPAQDGPDHVTHADTEPTEPVTNNDGSAGPSARMLELAAITADQLVSEAQTEAESLVTTAQAEADAILEASRNQAQQIAAELSRIRHEQTGELDRERATALTGLAQERAAIERQIAHLRQMQSDHRNELRRHLTTHLALLDATTPEPPTPSSH